MTLAKKVALVGRRRELQEIDRLLDRAETGSGGLLVLAGPSGSGRTALAREAVERARHRGLDVFPASSVGERPGLWPWAQVLRDIGARDELATRLLDDPGPLDLDAAASALCSGSRRLLIVDDADRGGSQAVELLAVLAGRVVVGPTAMICTSTAPLGIGRELRLGALTPAQVGSATGERRTDVRDALWLLSRGLPGPARLMAGRLAAMAPEDDLVVQLALLAESTEGFLDVDTGLVRLLETALLRTSADGLRARLLARLAHALLGDAAAVERRRALVDDALALARRSDDSAALAEVLDARLHALWDAAGAEDRLAAAAEIVDLARASADLPRERSGLFWRFVALMELGRVVEAESALAAYEREAHAAGDAAGEVMVVARHAMLATMRGRFDEAQVLIGRVADQGRAIGLADTDRLLGSLSGNIAILRGDQLGIGGALEVVREFARRIPGHFYEATVARVLLSLGRTAEADLELQRALPRLLDGAGPRWLGSAADLVEVAVATGNAAAGAQLYAALAPYRGRLVVWAGANTTAGPVSYYLGILAAQQGSLDEAVQHLEETVALADEIGALPMLARGRAVLADALSRRGAAGDAKRADDHLQQARRTAEQLGMLGFLATLSPPVEEWTLRRDGSDWLLAAGDEHVRLQHSRGMDYLRALLAAPGREIASLDLVAGGAGLQETTSEPVLDATAREAYSRRLGELAAELDAADQAGDPQRARRAESERAAVLDELRRASGLGGRVRNISGDGERARVNVTRTLRAALDRIVAAAPKAGAHLNTSVRTGRVCRYQPAPEGPSRWNL
jgi:AAA ATPase domain